jgi:hypothetical protein
MNINGGSNSMRIGLQIAKLEYGYGVKIWQSAMVYAKEIQADLIIFPGRNLNTPHGFDYQYNSIFRFMNKENLDALILVSTLVTNYVNNVCHARFLLSIQNNSNCQFRIEVTWHSKHHNRQPVLVLEIL